MNRAILTRFANQEHTTEMNIVKRACEAAKRHPMEGMVTIFRELHDEFLRSPDESVSLMDKNFW